MLHREHWQADLLTAEADDDLRAEFKMSCPTSVFTRGR